MLHTNGGGEFFNTCLDLWLHEQGIQHPPAPQYTSEYNGLSERFSCMLLARICCCLLDSGLPNCYWAEAAVHTAHLVNCTPTKANTNNLLLYQVWHG
jgi:hypothetical protein